MKNALMLCTAALALGASMAAAEEVRVYNWSDYIDEALLEKFEQETGLELVYDVFDSNEVLETKMLAGGSGYDVVVPTGTFLQRQIAAGAFQPLDKSKLSNLDNMWDVISDRTAKYDPENAHAINYMWGTTGLGVNLGKVREVLGEDAPVDSWDLVFKAENMEKLAECGVHFLDAPAEMIPAALNYIGEDPDSHDPEVIAKAEAVYEPVRPFIQKFHSSEYINALANGDICVAVGWSGDVLQARDRAAEADNGVEIGYFAPNEGAQMWFDMMAIPVDAPNPEGAHTFLNFIMDAQNMAAASNYVYYANGNLAAQEFLAEDVITDPAIYPTPAAMDNTYTTTPYPPKVQRVVTRLWTKIKSGT
ncbi:MAG: polyamine ABC transporter substrate-binding protein [Marinovum algicola]|jgi:putrescine transport system substrate-binding protein|uniref:Putrescine-binding periplasmic protein n=1 Tax=Marinovum algicola TaxID=42444 RepID=A0A975ZMZ0_9RHOB|nr:MULTISPECIES: polyamine ABC transporter substrate-binding protein [Marinovum]AKO98424.1 Putrescine ABC transporter putrescine-binding protein PotF [Marinovum algicola DG 898]MDD9740471.1 polyamine ABC transporter substrate-binding protein [Marinovum sp. SP66]MDD9746497.1 polyamine ABC transporter substrate-binding protein [Marinovum sp. PR37]SEJ25743.1 putrescine transport system substrate-binding protein [Marinovum algicola]SLN47362.1 Putrescine-binding periplasmic protein precursor [Marin